VINFANGKPFELVGKVKGGKKEVQQYVGSGKTGAWLFVTFMAFIFPHSLRMIHIF